MKRFTAALVAALCFFLSCFRCVAWCADVFYPVGDPYVRPAYRNSNPNGYQVYWPFLQEDEGVVHLGVDLAGQEGGSLRAALGGLIYEVRRNPAIGPIDVDGNPMPGAKPYWNGGWGVSVIIKTTVDGIVKYEQHAHMVPAGPIMALSQGDPIRAGELIGYVGSTGRSSGPHDHAELKIESSFGPGYLPLGSTRISSFENILDFIEQRQGNVPMEQRIGYFSDGWRTDGSSDAILSAYAHHGGSAVLGVPTDNGGSAYVHTWNGITIQDFYNATTNRWYALIYNPTMQQAFLLRDGFRFWYLANDGPAQLGLPTSDEPAPSQTATSSRQAFQYGSLVWQNNQINAVDQYGQRLGPVLNLGTAVLDQTTVRLAWLPVSTAATYQVIRDGAVVAQTTSTNYQITNLSTEPSYCQIQCKEVGGGIIASSDVLVLTQPTTHPTPTDPTRFTLTMPTYGATYVDLSWDSVSTASGYQLCLNGTWQQGKFLGTSVRIGSLVPQTRNRFIVRALHPDYDYISIAQSNEVSIVTAALDTDPVPTPTPTPTPTPIPVLPTKPDDMPMLVHDWVDTVVSLDGYYSNQSALRGGDTTGQSIELGGSSTAGRYYGMFKCIPGNLPAVPATTRVYLGLYAFNKPVTAGTLQIRTINRDWGSSWVHEYYFNTRLRPYTTIVGTYPQRMVGGWHYIDITSCYQALRQGSAYGLYLEPYTYGLDSRLTVASMDHPDPTLRPRIAFLQLSWPIPDPVVDGADTAILPTYGSAIGTSWQQPGRGYADGYDRPTATLCYKPDEEKRTRYVVRYDLPDSTAYDQATLHLWVDGIDPYDPQTNTLLVSRLATPFIPPVDWIYSWYVPGGDIDPTAQAQIPVTQAGYLQADISPLLHPGINYLILEVQQGPDQRDTITIGTHAHTDAGHWPLLILSQDVAPTPTPTPTPVPVPTTSQVSSVVQINRFYDTTCGQAGKAISTELCIANRPSVSKDVRGLLQLPTPSAPPRRATLHYVLTRTSEYQPNTLHAAALSRPYDTATVSYCTPWASLGGDYRTDLQTSVLQSATPGTYQLDITALAIAWYQGQLPNYGLLLYQASSGSHNRNQELYLDGARITISCEY